MLGERRAAPRDTRGRLDGQLCLLASRERTTWTCPARTSIGAVVGQPGRLHRHAHGDAPVVAPAADDRRAQRDEQIVAEKRQSLSDLVVCQRAQRPEQGRRVDR